MALFLFLRSSRCSGASRSLPISVKPLQFLSIPPSAWHYSYYSNFFQTLPPISFNPPPKNFFQAPQISFKPIKFLSGKSVSILSAAGRGRWRAWILRRGCAACFPGLRGTALMSFCDGQPLRGCRRWRVPYYAGSGLP